MKLADALKGVQRVYLDSSPIIYHVEANATYQIVLDAFFLEVNTGRLIAVVGSVTLAECMVQPYRAANLARVQAFRDFITSKANVTFATLGLAAEYAGALRAKYPWLRTPDALQVATAIAVSCDALLTNDHALKRVAEIPILVLDDLTV